MRSKRIKFSKRLKAVLFEKMQTGITASEAVEISREEIETIPETSRIEAGDLAMIRTLLRSMGGWSLRGADVDGEGMYKLEEAMTLEELSILYKNKEDSIEANTETKNRIGSLIAEKEALKKAVNSPQMLLVDNEYQSRTQEIDRELASIAAAQG